MEQPGHSAQPKAGSFRTADGRKADLFALEHYPVYATCQVCERRIRAGSFALPFEHLPQSAAESEKD
jgi:hypothetical protein